MVTGRACQFYLVCCIFDEGCVSTNLNEGCVFIFNGHNKGVCPLMRGVSPHVEMATVARKVLDVFKAEIKRAQLSRDTPVGDGLCM